MSLKDQLSTQFDTLSPQLQKAARFVLDKPEDVALKSIREVSELADVTTNVLVRLAKALDFEGYAAFRAVFQNEMRQQPKGLAVMGARLQSAQNTQGEIFQQVHEQTLFNLNQTLDTANQAKMERAVKRIAQSKGLYVMGLRSCYPVAYSFYYAYSMFSPKACLVEGHAGTLGDELRPIGYEDVLLIISTNPFSRDAVKAAQFARQKGAFVIVMVDQAITPFHDVADITFECASHSTTLFASTTGLLALGEIMVAELLGHAGPDALKAMEISQKQLTEFNAYWPD